MLIVGADDYPLTFVAHIINVVYEETSCTEAEHDSGLIEDRVDLGASVARGLLRTNKVQLVGVPQKGALRLPNPTHVPQDKGDQARLHAPADHWGKEGGSGGSPERGYVRLPTRESSIDGPHHECAEPTQAEEQHVRVYGSLLEQRAPQLGSACDHKWKAHMPKEQGLVAGRCRRRSGTTRCRVLRKGGRSSCRSF